MGRRRGPWDDGHRAWTRLTEWQANRHGGTDATSGDDALEAMADIGILRRLLEHSELAAVRTARRHRKSWAEIATQLGITRQSAWERWRELDDEDGDEALLESTVVRGQSSSELPPDRPALGRRRNVVVPNVVGMLFSEARVALLHARLLAMNAHADASGVTRGDGTVVDQIPEAGAKVPAGTQVRLWVEQQGGGGSAGVREPRRPSPAPKSGYEWYDEPTGHDEQAEEAVG